jgi:RNA polymerase sigma factor (TIGR02999 family)
VRHSRDTCGLVLRRNARRREHAAQFAAFAGVQSRSVNHIASDFVSLFLCFDPLRHSGCYDLSMRDPPDPTFALPALQADAHDALINAVYAELRALAARLLAGERPGHTLSPTALVHEAYLRIVGDSAVAAADRRQVIAIAARRMRQVLVDHARRRDAGKRGGGHLQRVTLSDWSDSAADSAKAEVDLLALEQALEQLEAADPRKVRVVELRYFGGLEMAEIATVLEVSRATAQRDWDVARAFLYQSLQ